MCKITYNWLDIKNFANYKSRLDLLPLKNRFVILGETKNLVNFTAKTQNIYLSKEETFAILSKSGGTYENRKEE